MNPSPDRLLAPDQVAEVLAVSRQTVYRYIREGALPALRMSRVLAHIPALTGRQRGKNQTIRVSILALEGFLVACGDREAHLRLKKFL